MISLLKYSDAEVNNFSVQKTLILNRKSYLKSDTHIKPTVAFCCTYGSPCVDVLTAECVGPFVGLIPEWVTVALLQWAMLAVSGIFIGPILTLFVSITA